MVGFFGLLSLNLIGADFQGRPLRSWLTEFDSCFITGPNAAWQSTATLAAVSNAALAVKAAGTNSIPVLVEMTASTNFEDPWRALCGFQSFRHKWFWCTPGAFEAS